MIDKPDYRVRCGGLGCLTDSCEHWGNPACDVLKGTPCLLGRMIDSPSPSDARERVIQAAELRQILIDADSALSLLYHRYGGLIESNLGAEFREQIGKLYQRCRLAYEAMK